MYLALKSLHIIAVVLFLGNVITGVFWKSHADQTGDPRIIAHTLDGIIRGLGLATAYGIVKQSGGYIKVRFALHEGTEFAIYLPRGAGAPETLTPAENPPEPEEGRLLVVEDEPAVSSALTRMLRAAGYVVTTARNGGEAWELFLARKGEFDLLLTDLVLPELGGKELAEKCRVVNPALKVLFVSGYTQDSIFSQQTFHKGTQFLSKPFSRDAILSKVATVLAIR